jgi:hypothetical protein
MVNYRTARFIGSSAFADDDALIRYAAQRRIFIVPLCFAARQTFECVIGACLRLACWYRSASPLRHDFFRMVRS